MITAPLLLFISKNFEFSGVMSLMPTPMYACSTLPVRIRLSTTGFAICEGIANPMPENAPDGEIRKVLIPYHLSARIHRALHLNCPG